MDLLKKCKEYRKAGTLVVVQYGKTLSVNGVITLVKDGRVYVQALHGGEYGIPLKSVRSVDA